MMNENQATYWRRLIAPARHAFLVAQDHVRRGDMIFWVARGVFRRLPLRADAREKVRRFYQKHLSKGLRAARVYVPMSGHVWGTMNDGRWSRERYEAEKKELETLSVVLRKEKF